MITDHNGEERQPEVGMKIKSLYSGAVYEILEIINGGKTFVVGKGAHIPAGLDYQLFSQ